MKKLLVALLSKGSPSIEGDGQEFSDEENDNFAVEPEGMACGGEVMGYADGGEVESPEEQKKRRMSSIMAKLSSRRMAQE